MASKNKAHSFVLIGAGNVGRSIVKDILAVRKRLNVEISAIVDPDAANARSFQQILEKKVPVYKSLDELKKKHETHPDFSIVTVPAQVRVKTVLQALDSGLDCLVEKPIAFSAADAQKIREKARAKSKHVQVILPQRWTLAHLWGNFKPVKGPWTINSMRTGPFVSRAADVDIVYDYVVEDMDLFVLLDEVFNLSPIKAIRSWGRKVRSSHYDWVSIALELENGGICRFFASRLSTQVVHTWEITGREWHGTLDFRKQSFQRFCHVGHNLNAFDATSRSGLAGSPMELELMTFFSTIQNGMYKGKYDLSHLSTLGVRSRSVLRTHEIIDEVLSVMRIVD